MIGKTVIVEEIVIVEVGFQSLYSYPGSQALSRVPVASFHEHFRDRVTDAAGNLGNLKLFVCWLWDILFKDHVFPYVPNGRESRLPFSWFSILN